MTSIEVIAKDYIAECDCCKERAPHSPIRVGIKVSVDGKHFANIPDELYSYKGQEIQRAKEYLTRAGHQIIDHMNLDRWCHAYGVKLTFTKERATEEEVKAWLNQ